MTENRKYRRLWLGWLLAFSWLTALWVVDRFRVNSDRSPASSQQREQSSKAVFRTLEESDLYP